MSRNWVDRWGEIVARELKDRNWVLAQPDGTFVQRVIEELRTRFADPDAVSLGDVTRATVRCYALILHQACSEDGTESQQRVFEELWDHLYPRALYRLHDSAQAQDATQQALVRIWEKRATCESPKSFLAWCDQVLLNLIREQFREQYVRCLTERGIEYEERTIVLQDVGENDLGGEPNPAEEALRGPMRDALIAALRACLKNDRHVAVIVELFLNDKSFLQVAEQLQMTPLNVQVTKSRALKKLRDCPEIQNLFQDWLS